jgi:hypothetical protein
MHELLQLFLVIVATGFLILWVLYFVFPNTRTPLLNNFRMIVLPVLIGLTFVAEIIWSSFDSAESERRGKRTLDTIDKTFSSAFYMPEEMDGGRKKKGKKSRR